MREYVANQMSPDKINNISLASAEEFQKPNVFLDPRCCPYAL